MSFDVVDIYIYIRQSVQCGMELISRFSTFTTSHLGGGVLNSDISAYHGRIMVSRSQPSNFLLPLKMRDTNSVLNSNAIFFITTSYLSK